MGIQFISMQGVKPCPVQAGMPARGKGQIRGAVVA